MTLSDILRGGLKEGEGWKGRQSSLARAVIDDEKMRIPTSSSDSVLQAAGENEQRSEFRVLALHGGGIHGVATAAYLADLEKHSDTRVLEHFDLLVGTSTGGIIALALSLGIPASEIETLYCEHGAEIFSRRIPLPLPSWIAGFFGPVYYDDSLHQLLADILGPATQLGDANCPLCIPAINITAGRNVVFKTRHRPEYERDHELKMWRVAGATAAAPVYFPPTHIPDRGWFVDGGLWSNAPIEVGIAEGCKLGYALDRIEVLSIGTGQRAFCRNGTAHWLLRNARHGAAGWGLDLVDLVMRSQSQRSRNLAEYLLPDDQLVHVDFPLHDGAGGLDAVGEVDTFADRARTQAKRNGQSVRRRFFQSRTAESDTR